MRRLRLALDDHVETIRRVALLEDDVARCEHQKLGLARGLSDDLFRLRRKRALEILELLDVSLGMEHRGRGVAHRGRDLLRELGTRVARRVNAWDARPHELVGYEVAILVVVDVLLEEMSADRLEADEDENPFDIHALGPTVAIDVDPLHVTVAADLGDPGRRDGLDLVHFAKAVLEDRLRAELVAPVNDVE